MDNELICRACLSMTSKCISVFKAPNLWGKNITLSKMIMACAPVEITPNDGLPSKICDNCLMQLQFAFLFRMRVLQANEELKNYVRQNLVPRLQPMTEGFLEPLAAPITLNTVPCTQPVYTMEQIMETLEKENDPLNINQFCSSNIKKEIDIKLEPMDTQIPIPFEEVMLTTENSLPLATNEITRTDSDVGANRIVYNQNMNNNSKSMNDSSIIHHTTAANQINCQAQTTRINECIPEPAPVAASVIPATTGANMIELSDADKKMIANIFEAMQQQTMASNTNKNYFVIKTGTASSQEVTTSNAADSSTCSSVPEPTQKRPKRPANKTTKTAAKNVPNHDLTKVHSAPNLRVNLERIDKEPSEFEKFLKSRQKQMYMPYEESLPIKRTYSRINTKKSSDTQCSSIDLTSDDEATNICASKKSNTRETTTSTSATTSPLIRTSSGASKQTTPQNLLHNNKNITSRSTNESISCIVIDD